MAFLKLENLLTLILIYCFAVQNTQAQSHSFAVWAGIGTHKQMVDIGNSTLIYKKVNKKINHNYNVRLTGLISKKFQFEFGMSKYNSETIYNMNYNFLNHNEKQDNINLNLKNSYNNYDISVLMSVYNTKKINIGIKIGASAIENSFVLNKIEEKPLLTSDNQVFGKIKTIQYEFSDACFVYGLSAQKKISRRFMAAMNFRKIIGGNRLTKLAYIDLQSINGQKINTRIGVTNNYNSVEFSIGYIIN